MELICVGIAENTLTDDVAAFARDDSVKPSIKGLMADHLLDEGRHSTFWARLTRIYWSQAPEPDRQVIARLLPLFIRHYLTNDLQKAFDIQLIAALDVPAHVAAALREEVTAMAWPINHQHPLLGNILRFFRSSSLLDAPCVQAALVDYLPSGRPS